MQAAWIVPTVADVKACFGQIFIQQDSGDAADPDALIGTWLPIVIAQIRGAIGRGNRRALSLTASSVPPEAKIHAIALTAEACIVNTPRMVQFVQLEPMKNLLIDARKFVADCMNGANVTQPTDPDTAQLPSGVLWGDAYNVPGSASSAIDDMTIDGPGVASGNSIPPNRILVMDGPPTSNPADVTVTWLWKDRLSGGQWVWDYLNLEWI